MIWVLSKFSLVAVAGKAYRVARAEQTSLETMENNDREILVAYTKALAVEMVKSAQILNTFVK